MLIERMAKELGLSKAFIASLASSASHEYKRFTIKKKNGGEREICHPSRKLKALQTWVLRTTVVSLRVHPACMAYRTGISIYDNASLHVKNRYLLRLDLENFFPSIVTNDFIQYVESNSDLSSLWPKEDVGLLASILFRHGKLTIGAPTSPALSNALCFDMDSELSRLSERREVTYSRYADDLFFSCDKRGALAAVEVEVAEAINALKLPANLKLNKSKTVHSSKKQRRQVTGLVLGSDKKVHVARAYKRKIRAMIYRYDTLSEADQVALPGMISFVAGFEPHFLNSLISKYGFELIDRVTKLRPLLDRQRVHLPKVKPSPSRKLRVSSTEVLRELLKKAGYGNE